MARNRTPRFMNLFSPERGSSRTNRWRKGFPKFSLSSWHSSRIVESVCGVFRAGAEAARAVREATGSQMVTASASKSLRLEGLEARQMLTNAPWNLSTGDFSQDWTNTALIPFNDNWSNVPSIQGFLGDITPDIAAGTNPGTVIGPGSGTQDVIANAVNPNTLGTGGVAEFDGTLLFDSFDSYANQAAFTTAWPAIGTVGTISAQLSSTTSVSSPNSISVPGGALTGEYRNRRSFTDTPALAIGDRVVWSYDFFDSNAASAPQRNSANLQDTTAPGSSNQLVSMGLNNNQTNANSGGNYYMARILGYFTTTGAPDPDGGPAESVSGSGVNPPGINYNYFKLNDFGAGLRSTGWHNLKVVISTDDGLSTDYDFYVDNVLAERVSNVGTAPRQYDNITIGSGNSNGSVGASFDNVQVQFLSATANPVVALQGSGTADAPSLNLHMNSQGRENVTVSYNLRDIDGSADDAIQAVALQYRIGNSGDFINVPTAFVADASGGPSQATLVTAVSNISLPEWRNQANLQLRIITTNAGGNDEWIGVDDIQVTSTALAAPSFGLDNYAFSVSENSANGASVGAVAATDSSAGETLTYSIASGNESGAFAIDASTGQITIAGGTQLNFEATPQIVLSLVVTDGTGQTDTASATISLTDAPEPPTIDSLSLSTGPYLEGSPVTATATASDPENNSLTYRWKTFRGGGLILHESQGVTSHYSYTPADDGDYTIELTVEDGEGGVTTSSLPFTVDNSPPVVEISHSVAPGHAVAIGHDFELTLTSSDVGDDTFDTWFINWGDGSDIQEVTAAPRAMNGGVWKTITTATHQYAAPGTFSVSATGEDEDCDGTSDDRYATNSVSATVDTLPVINLPPAPVTAKVARATLKSFFETGDIPTSDQFTLLADRGAVVNNGDGTWTWTDSPSSIGSYDVTLTFTKPNGLSNTGTFSVSVIENTPPVFSPPGSVTISENSSVALLLDATDDDTPPAQMQWAIVGGDDASSFVVNSHTSAFDLSFASPPDFESPTDADHDNVYEVTVEATDLDGGKSSATILFTVTNIDDASPVADIGGPYENVDSTLPFVLDGTRSTDDGTIQSYEWSLIDDVGAEIFLARGVIAGITSTGLIEFHWDVDNDGQTDDAVTNSPSLTLPPHTLVPGSYTFSLRVIDATGLVSTSSTSMSVIGEASRISVLSGDVDGDQISDISIRITGGEQNDVRVELASSPGGGMPIVKIYDGDTLLSEQSGRPLGGKIYVYGGTGNDAFTVRGTFSDLSTADVTQIVYDGGGGFDTLAISMNYAKITYEYRNPNDGKVSVQDSSSNEVVGIDYTGLEPIVNTGTGADAEFILTGGVDNATLKSLGGGMYRLQGSTFETTDFALPTGSLTIRGGGDGDSLTIDDAVAFIPAITLDFETINLGADVDTTTLTGGANTATVNVLNNTARIVDAVALVAANGTVNLSAGTFDEDVLLNKQGISLIGAGPTLTTLRGAIGGALSSTVRIEANGVEVAGLTITRDGNTVAQWNLPTLNSAGLAIQGAFTGAEIHDVIFTGNRSAIDVNNSSGHTIRNSVITDNHTGVIFRNVTDNITFTENAVTNNRTVGILFLDASGGTNVPAQQALGSSFNNNNISGNWYGEVVDRQSGGALPAPGTTNLKNFENNWYGTTTPVLTTANSAEPPYASLIPPSAGGSATNPGGAPDIAGPASANIDYTPFLQSGLDTDVETTPGNGIFGFQGFTARPEVWVDDDWSILVDIGPAGLSQGDLVESDADDGDAFVTGKYFGYDAYASAVDGLAAVEDGGTIHILVGSFTGALSISKDVTIDGQSESSSLLNAGGASTGIFVQNGASVVINDVSLSNIGAAGVGVHVQGDLDLTDSTVTGGQTVVFVDGGDLDMLRTRVQAAPAISIYGVSVASGGAADIVDSEITGNGVSTAAAVAVSGSLSQTSAVSITGSVLAGSSYGLLNNPYGVSEVHESDLSGNTLLGVANADADAVVDASNNWWGTTNEILVLAETLGRVDVTPFLNAGDTNLLARGFQADTSLLNVTTLGEQSGPTGRIQEGVDLVDVSGTVSVRDGVYDETVLVNKTATLQSTNLQGAQIKPTTGSQQTVVRVDAANVTIDGFAIQVNQNDDGLIVGTAPIAPVGIGAVGTVMDGLLLSDNMITSIGNNASVNWTGSPGLTVRAAGIVLNDAPSGGIPSVTLTNNNVSILSGTNFFQRAVWLSQLNADITGNTLAGFANDLIFQFASGGPSLIQGNNFVGVHSSGGSGVVIGDPNGGSQIDVIGNNFTPLVSAAPSTSLQVNRNVNGATSPINIQGNFFTGYTVSGVDVGGAGGVTVSGNTFTPKAGTAGFVSVVVDSQNASNNASTASPVDTKIFSNTFNTNGGTGTAILAENNLVGATYAPGGVQIGVGGANTYNGAHTTGVSVTGGVATVTDNITGAGTGLSASGGTTTLAGSTLAGNTTGVSVSGSGALTVGSGNAISGGTTGILLSGAGVGLTSLTFNDVSIDATGDYITLANSAFDNQDLIATGTTLGGVAVGSMSNAQKFAATNKITDESDNNSLGLVLLATNTIFVTPVAPGSATPTDNDYTRIKNAIEAAGDNWTIDLLGTFNWVESNASASWALGNDGLPATADDYSILVAGGLEGVTLTASSGLGTAIIQGPGDLAAVDLEGFLYFPGGSNASDDNKGWTISNLEIRDFDLSIGMFNSSAGVDAFDNTKILNNRIRVATDLNATVAPGDTFQNIGIHYSFGVNQTIQGNFIDIPGNGVSDSANLLFASTVGMQSNTSGGAVYDGLLIDNNTTTVLNAQSADPENILGIWENGHAHTSDITVSNNNFVSNAVGNNPVANRQRAFRVTSHSGASSTVTYSGNTVSGANTGFQWIAGSNFAGNQAVQVTGNTLTNVNTGFLIQSNGLANLSGNSLTNSGAMAGVGIGVDVAAGSVVSIDGSVNENTITGFATGIRSAGTVTIDGNDASIHGNVVGVDVTGGTATISNNHIYDNTIGVRFATTGGGSVTNNNFDDGTAGDGLDDNATDLFIAADAGAVAVGAGNDFAGDTFFIDNQSTTSYDLSANGTTFDELGLDANFRIEDKIHHRVDTDLALSIGLVTWVAGNLFVTTPSSTDSSIQRAIDAAVASNTVNIEAGLYNENLSISKAIKLLGVGAVTLSPSTGGNLVTIDGASFGGDNLVSITNIDLDGSAGLGDVGVRVNNTASFANLTIADSSFTGFDFNAVAVFGDAVTGLSVLDVDITNSTFANNGLGGGGGTGDLQFFEYNGDATLTGLDLVGSATATTGARLGIQFRGTGGATGTGVQAMGVVTLNDVDVSGDYRTQMIGIQRYTDVDDLTFTNVALGGATSAITGTFGASLRFDAVGFGSLATPETFNLGNTLFRGLDPLSAQRHEIEIAPDNSHTFLRVDGTGTTWTIGGIDVAASSLSLAQAFAVEDRILHYVDKLNPTHGAYKGFVEIKSGQSFITDDLDAGVVGDGSIQRGIDIVVEDGVVNVEAGTFAENLVISKEVNVIGAVNGLGVATTTLTPAGPVGDLIAVSGVIADVGLDGQGVLIQNFNLNGLAGTAGYGVRVQSTTGLNNLTVDNSNFTGFSFNAIAVFGNATTGISVQDVDVTNSTFVDNGIAGGGGSGDLQFFEYNGSATLTNLDLSNTGAGADAHTGIQFRGVGLQNGAGVLPMGAITFTDVDISGLYVRQMIGLQRYDTAGISLNDVRLGGVGSAITGTFGAALRIDAVGDGTFASPTTIDLGDTYFRGVGGLGLDVEIAPDGFGFLRADATDTRWDTTLSSGQTPDNLTLAEQFEIEDRILHYVDLLHPNPLFGAFDGFVETVDGEAFVTTTQGGSIQRGVDVVDLGGTVNVAAGTYNQSVVVTKNVNLRGVGADVDPELRDLIGALAAETTVSVSGASDVAFHVVNGLTDVTINGFNITGNDAALQGVNGSSHTGLKVLNNFVHDFVSIAVAIETGVTGALVQYNELFDSYAGVYLATGASAITVRDNYIHDSTSSEGDVTLEGDNQNVLIRNNTLDSATAAGVYVFAAFGSNFAGTTIVDNAFLGAVGVNNTNSATLDADGNWWGSVYGPTSAANPWDGVQPTGASVLGNVTFTPWLTDGTDTAPNVSGFQPNLGDVTAPGATAIDLVTDSGNPTDNVTNDNTPTLAGVTEVGALVDVGIWVDTALNPGVVDDGEVTLVAADEADGSGAWAVTLGLLADGTYQFVARVTDLAGNASGWSAPLAVTIDSVITPATTIDLPAIYDSTSTSTIPVGSNSDNITNINTPTLEGTAEAGSTVRIYRNAVLVGTVTATAGGVWSFAPGVLADGPHTFVAEATDLASNVSSSGPLAVTVDTIGVPSSTPDMTAGTDLGVSNSDNVTNDNTPTFTGTAEAGAFVELMLNGTTVLATGNALGGTWTITAGVAIPNGAHSITARVTDIAGNVSTSPALPITIDTVAPTADGGPDLEYVPSGVPLTITGTAADGLSGVATAEWQFVSSTNGQVVPNSSNPLTFTPIGPGSYSFNFVVTDVAGNVTIDAVAIASTYTADFDLDGDVDGNDLGDWQAGFGTSPNATVGQGDEDRDGDVDGSDFLNWQRQLGSTVVATVAAVGNSAPTSSQSALGAEAEAVSVDAVAEAMESEPSTLQTASWWLQSPAISHHRSEAPARSRDSDAAFHDWSERYDSAASAVSVVNAEDESDEFAAIEDLYQDQDDSEALGNEFDEALLSWLEG